MDKNEVVRDERGRWLKGTPSPSPGRPPGARSKFSDAAMTHLLEDWLSNGPAVLARVRQQDPSTYLRVAFSTIPKDVQLQIEQRSGPMDSAEMRMVRRLVDMIEASGAANIADAETVFGWLEEDLRARLATPVESK